MINCCLAIALSFGYVEGNTTSWLIFRSEEVLPRTRKAALHSLVEYLWDKFQKEQSETDNLNKNHKWDMAKCCQKAWAKRDDQNPPNNCPTCQASYNVENKKSFSISKWHEYLVNLYSSDCNSYGEHDWAHNPQGWSPWEFQFDIPQHQMLIVAENAEHIITLALAELHPELKDICDEDDIFPDIKDSGRYGNYIVADYNRMLDEENVCINFNYFKPKDAVKNLTETTIVDLPNGSKYIMVNKIYTYIKYNTGDEIWLDFKDGEYIVTNVKTYDGMDWNEKFGTPLSGNA